MSEIQQIRDNFEKIQKLNEKLESLKQEEIEQKAEEPKVMEENVELQLLLEELEQQQQISVKLANQNTKLQKKLRQKQNRLEKAKADFESYQNKQNSIIENKRKAFQDQQDLEELNAQKEEKRLKASLQLLVEKNKKLKEEKELVSEKLSKMKSVMLSSKGKKAKKQ